MSLIERWTIWNTNRREDQPRHGAHVEGPDAGDWSGDGVEVVRADAYRGAVSAIDAALKAWDDYRAGTAFTAYEDAPELRAKMDALRAFGGQ